MEETKKKHRIDLKEFMIPPCMLREGGPTRSKSEDILFSAYTKSNISGEGHDMGSHF